MGKTLKVFIMGDEPTALRTVELSNWTGKAYIGGRSHLPEVKSRTDLSEPAVYLLLGEEGESRGGLIDFYIGETDNFVDRFSQHVQSKDWWDTFVVFIGKELTKAHVRYLERQLFLLAKSQLGTLRIQNSTEPGGARLPESDISAMEEFLQNMRFMLEALGLSYFPSKAAIGSIPEQKPIHRKLSTSGLEGIDFVMTLPRDLGLKDGEQYKALMNVVGTNYVLRAGSYIRGEAHESFGKQDSSYLRLWKQVVASDAVKPTGEKLILITTRDIEFRSPSAAGAVVRGRSTNGRENWKRIKDGKSLMECEGESVKVGS